MEVGRYFIVRENKRTRNLCRFWNVGRDKRINNTTPPLDLPIIQFVFTKRLVLLGGGEWEFMKTVVLYYRISIVIEY